MSKTQKLSENANNFLSLEETRNGQNTIKVNGIYLHSKYDPIKEAISFVNANIEEDQDTSGYLVLGLGLGYHVAELANRTNKQITVLEPNKELYNLANDVCGIETFKKINVYNNSNIDDLFFDQTFVNFLSGRPKTIVHPSSFKSNSKFYQSFLSYRTCNEMTPEAMNLLKECGIDTDMKESETFQAYSERLSAKKEIHHSEKLILATYAIFS